MTSVSPTGQHPKGSNSLNGLVHWLGVAASTLKRWWVLTFLTAASGAAMAYIPVHFLDELGRPLPWVGRSLAWLVVVLIVSALMDKLADHFDAKTSEAEAAKLDDLAEAQFTILNSFTEQCASTSELQGKSRQDHLDTLRKLLVLSASATLGKGARASYYTLKYDEQGLRVLDEPKHHLQHGRNDRSDTGFYEAKHPKNTIWKLLDRSDAEPRIVEYGDPCDGVDWDKVKYRTYYSVPVKYEQTVYGFLSVNTVEVGAFSESIKQAILGMARVYALTLLLAKK